MGRVEDRARTDEGGVRSRTTVTSFTVRPGPSVVGQFLNWMPIPRLRTRRPTLQTHHALIRGSIDGDPPLVTAGKRHGSFGLLSCRRFLDILDICPTDPTLPDLVFRRTLPVNLPAKTKDWLGAQLMVGPRLLPLIRGDAAVKTRRYPRSTLSIPAIEHLGGFDLGPPRLV